MAKMDQKQWPKFTLGLRKEMVVNGNDKLYGFVRRLRGIDRASREPQNGWRSHRAPAKKRRDKPLPHGDQNHIARKCSQAGKP